MKAKLDATDSAISAMLTANSSGSQTLDSSWDNLEQKMDELSDILESKFDSYKTSTENAINQLKTQLSELQNAAAAEKDAKKTIFKNSLSSYKTGILNDLITTFDSVDSIKTKLLAVKTAIESIESDDDIASIATKFSALEPLINTAKTAISDFHADSKTNFDTLKTEIEKIKNNITSPMTVSDLINQLANKLNELRIKIDNLKIKNPRSSLENDFNSIISSITDLQNKNNMNDYQNLSDLLTIFKTNLQSLMTKMDA